jgi:hypothetical protein
LVIFLAGTDVWHDVGSPNVWSLQTSPYPDLRACLYAFYLLFIVLVGSVILTVLTFTRARRVASKGV